LQLGSHTIGKSKTPLAACRRVRPYAAGAEATMMSPAPRAALIRQAVADPVLETVCAITKFQLNGRAAAIWREGERPAELSAEREADIPPEII
jgi:hypothetical protein